jgi:hypothetical protein
MPVTARSWDQVLARETLSKGTPEQVKADMYGVASAVYNRAIATGLSYDAVVGNKSQFNAFGVQLQPGDLDRVNLAKDIMADIEANGPVHNGTYFSTPETQNKLPSGLVDTGYAVDGGHVYKSDPYSRPITVAGGKVVQPSQGLIEQAIAAKQATVPTPQARPAAEALLDAPATPAPSEMPNVDVAKGSRFGLDPVDMGRFGTGGIPDAISVQDPENFDAGRFGPQQGTGPLSVSAMASALTGAPAPAQAAVSGLPDPGGYDMAARSMVENAPSNMAQTTLDRSAEVPQMATAVNPTTASSITAAPETATSEVTKSKPSSFQPGMTEMEKEQQARTQAAGGTEGYNKGMLNAGILGLGATQQIEALTSNPHTITAPTEVASTADTAPALEAPVEVGPAPTVAEAAPDAIAPDDPRYDLNGVPVANAPEVAAAEVPSAMPSNTVPGDIPADVAVDPKSAIETRDQVEEGSTYEGPVEAAAAPAAHKSMAESLLGSKTAGAAKGALAGGMIGGVPGAIAGGVGGYMLNGVNPLAELVKGLLGAQSSYNAQMGDITNIGGGLANVASVYGGGPGAVGTQANTNNGGTVTGLPGGGTAYTNSMGVTTVTTPTGGQAADWSGRDYDAVE